MVRHTRVQIQAALATGQLTLDQWDARRTDDGKVSVVDVIADVRAVGHDYAAQLYRRLLSEERVPQCEVRRLPPRAHSMASAENTLQRIGRGGARALHEILRGRLHSSCRLRASTKSIRFKLQKVCVFPVNTRSRFSYSIASRVPQAPCC